MIYVPIEKKVRYNPNVIEALESLPEFELVCEPSELPHYQAIAVARMKCIEKAEGEFVRMSDSRTKHLKKDNFEVMEKFLKDNPTFGGVVLNHTEKPIVGNARHMNIACVVMRKELVVDFNMPEKGCDCSAFGDHIRDKGFEFRWLEREPGRIVKLP